LKIAILSDIHSNGDALDAVSEKMESLGIDRVYQLGDLVGYNAEPEKCVRWAMERTAGGILGNHDEVACGKRGGESFNSPARIAALWAGQQISDASREYICSLQGRMVVDRELLLVHGSPSDPDRYLFTLDDAADELDGLDESGGIRVVFFGHTHVPAAVIRRADGGIVSVAPDEVRLGEGELAIMNPGSVGQPRDRDPRASFLVFDTVPGSASWIRVPYDIEECRKKIIAAGLPRLFANRLSDGM
jgi:predicted phosphodiesterase